MIFLQNKKKHMKLLDILDNQNSIILLFSLLIQDD